jgi:hypothetical protein
MYQSGSPFHRVACGQHAGRKAEGSRLTRTQALTVRGEKAGRAKLTREQVQAIRRAASTLPIAEIAALTGVTADNVRRIVRRETWKEESQCAA